MNAQEVWQSQSIDAPHVSLAYVRHRAGALEQRTKVRNAVEYLLAVVLVGFFAWQVWFYYPGRPIMAVANGWLCLSMIYFAVRWSQLAKAELLPTDMGVLDTLRFQRQQLDRQYRARHRSWRWWLAPVVVGAALIIVSNAVEVANVGWLKVLMMIAVFAVSIGVTNLLYEADASRIRREIEALDSLSAPDPERRQ